MTRGILVGGLLGSAWAAVVFNLGIIAGFPSSDVETFIEHTIQESTNGEYLVDLTDPAFLGLGGVSSKLDLYKGRRMGKRARRRLAESGETSDAPDHLFTIDKAHFRPLLLPMFAGKLMLGYDIQVSGNDVEGAVGKRGNLVYWQSDTTDFDLSAIPLSGDGWDVGLAGKLNLIADIIHDTEDPKISSGNLEISFEALELTKATISGFDLMATSFSESILRFEIADGRATVTEGKFIGDLLEVEVEGDIRLRKRLARSRLALTVKIKLDESLDRFAQMDSSMKRARDSEGYYSFRGSGTLSNPDFRPSSTRARKADTSQDDDDDGAGRTTRKPRSWSTDSDSSDDRRKKRRERIRKRRERMKERRRKRRERDNGTPTESRSRRGSDRVEPEPDDQEDDYEEDDLPIDEQDDEEGDLPPVQPTDQYDEGGDDYDEPNLPNGMGYVDE